MSKSAHRHVARLAVEAPRSDGSGVVVVDACVAPTLDSGGYVFRPSIDLLPPESGHSHRCEPTNTKPQSLAALFATVAIASSLTILIGLALNHFVIG